MNAMRATSLAETTLRDPVPVDGFEVLDACHRKMLAMVVELSTLVGEVERGESDRTTSARATRIAAFFSTTPPEHHADEERHVFPALIAGGDPQIVQAVLRLQQDHDWLEENWFELGPHVQAIAAGHHSCDIDFLRAGVEVLAALYRDHIELEESLIYPEARSRIPDRQRGEMGREMAARHRAERAARRAR
jgi:iron-sulfur cluster repair protein YtfE (RIC family)